MGKSALSKEQAEAVTRRSVLADGSQCYRISKYTQVVTRLAPDCLLVTGFGYNSGECAPLVTAELARAIPEAGKLTTFVNLTAQTGQASVAREWWAAWARQHRPRLAATHILVRSRMMDMAISVMAMIIGGGMIQSHTDPAEFAATIGVRVPGFRGLPTFSDLPPLLD
jgi:hypothetical protein